jgi:hypothetical protein
MARALEKVATFTIGVSKACKCDCGYLLSGGAFQPKGSLVRDSAIFLDKRPEIERVKF